MALSPPDPTPLLELRDPSDPFLTLPLQVFIPAAFRDTGGGGGPWAGLSLGTHPSQGKQSTSCAMTASTLPTSILLLNPLGNWLFPLVKFPTDLFRLIS